MKTLPLILLASATLFSACSKGDQTADHFFDSKGHENRNRTIGIWVDGDGCEHWAIDDGIEG